MARSRLMCALASCVLVMALSGISAEAAQKAKAGSTTKKAVTLKTNSRDPYIGAIAVDVSTGKVFSEDNADARIYPASVVKLMDLLIILEQIEKGKVRLADHITINAEVSRIGGSEAWLKEKEVFTVEDLLYALIVKSANDAAVALAIHIAGSKDGFVKLMNQRAAELGMSNTVFSSVHGLPPSPGQKFDVTTPRDLAMLGLEMVKHPEVFRYTSTVKRELMDVGKTRKEALIMEAHNHLLEGVEGCDGLKTGWTTMSGYSIVATAQRNQRRVIAVVGGSLSRTARDTKAKELIAEAFLNLPSLEPVKPAVAEPTDPPVEAEKASGTSSRTRMIVGIFMGLLVVVAIGSHLMMRQFRQYRSNIDFPGMK